MNLTLRRGTLAARGWRLFFVGAGVLYHEPVCPQTPPFKMAPDQERLWEEVPFTQISDSDLCKLPAIETDAGLAIAELDGFCRTFQGQPRQKPYHWIVELDQVHVGKYLCTVYGGDIPDDIDIEPCADTIAECICLAIVQTAAAIQK